MIVIIVTKWVVRLLKKQLNSILQDEKTNKQKNKLWELRHQHTICLKTTQTKKITLFPFSAGSYI